MNNESSPSKQLENKERNLFFIIGVGRSGTTLLQEMINTYEGFCNNAESRIYGPDTTSCWTPIRKNNDFSYLEYFINQHWTSTYFVEKTPDSILCLPQMLCRFPNSNFIFLERNPLHIVLSQLNMFSSSRSDIRQRYYHIENLIMEKSDLLLNREQFLAKLTLKQVQHQVLHKSKFRNSITIRYELLITSPLEAISSIENFLGVKGDMKKALECLNHPSSSSKNNKYEIKELTDPIAINIINTACRLWKYKLDSPKDNK